jgi:plastocyanin/glucose/arabinose dehydrogenase
MLRRGLLVVLAAMAASPASAHATHEPAKTVTAQNFLYTPTPTAIAEGGHLDFTNLDGAPHDVVARDNGADGNPLFRSAVVGQGITTPVAGTEDLDPGAYAFFCSVHPFMTGAVTVGADVPETPEVPEQPPGAPSATPFGLVPTATSLTVHDGSLYVAGWAQNTIYKLPILPGGAPGPALPYVTGVSAPLGVTFSPDGTMFVADSHPAATAGRGTAGRVWAIPPGGGNAGTVGQIVVDELPNGRHNTNGMEVRDGRLYITNGNSTDDGVAGGDPEAPLSGTLLSVPVGARGIVVGQPGDEAIRVEAKGMRNIYDVAFRPGTSEAWMPTNGLDAQDPWGEDTLLRTDVAATVTTTTTSGRKKKATTTTVTEDAPPDDFGFPGCVYGRDQATPYRQNLNPAVTDVCDGTHKAPEQLLGLHVSADGLAFGPQGGFWDGDLVVALFGNFSGSQMVGHELVRVPVDAAGNSQPPQDLLAGGLPLDVAFNGDDLYVADFAAGVILLKPPPVALPGTSGL